MPKEFARSRRVSEQLQRELAQLIQFQLKDPRLGMVTISAVEVSRDLANAKIYVTSLSTPLDDQKAVISVLQNAAGFLRHELSKVLQMRSVPQLRFYYDNSIARGAHLSALIDAAVSQDRHTSHEEESDE